MGDESKIELGEGRGGQPLLRLAHSSGASVEVYPHGATITSWKTGDGAERLFLSESAKFDGATPIRGGIPLVFPQFGGGALPSHGFARRSKWTVVEAGDGHGLLRLEPTEAITAMWAHAFKVDFSIDFDATTLTTSMSITNTGSDAFKFQALQHTYLRAADVSTVRIEGLNGCTCDDKLTEDGRFTDDRESFGIAEETDRIYVDVSGKPVLVRNLLADGDALQSVATATLDGKAAANDVVVWNPWIAKAKRMGDFGDDEYPNMLCIEPGFVAAWNELAAGGVWTLKQVLGPVASKG